MKHLALALVALVTAAAPAHAGPVAAIAAWVGSTIAAGGVLGFVVSTAVGTALNVVRGGSRKRHLRRLPIHWHPFCIGGFAMFGPG